MAGEHRLVQISLNMETHDVDVMRFATQWIDIGRDVSMRLNLANAKRLRDAAAEVVLSLSPLPDFVAVAQAEAAPDPLQWRKGLGEYTHLYLDGVMVADYHVRGDGSAGVRRRGSATAGGPNHWDVIDEPAARRVCIEIAEGTR